MKRLFSILLALMLVAAMVPQSLAVEETKFEGYEYVFSREAVDTENNPNLLNDKGRLLTSTMATMKLTHIEEAASAAWRPASHNYITGAEVKTAANGGMYWKATKDPADMLTCYAIELDVKNGGKYIPSITVTKKNSSPIVDVYLVKEGTSANERSTADFNFPSTAGSKDSARDADLATFVGGSDANKRPETYKLGTLDLYTDSETTPVTSFSERTLDSNSKYYLIFHSVGKNEKCVANNTLYEVYVSSFKLTYVEEETNDMFDYEEKEYTAASTTQVTALAAYGNGKAIEDSEVVSVTNVEYGKSCNVSVKSETVEKNDKTYNFSHWARGAATGANKMVISSEASFDYKPSEGNNILIAVFEEVGAEKAEAFYNYNGQLLSDLKIKDNKLPDLPSMAGFEAPATKWVQLGTNEEFDADADISEIAGGKSFIAKYDSLTDNIKIAVDGEEKTYSYGDTVNCIASAPEGKYFMYWEKTISGKADAEIVSASETYSFSAWEDCKVNAVYGDEKPTLARAARKIIISSVPAGNDVGVMAEFIGFEDALEKGIVLGNQKIAMITGKTQFTIINDSAEHVVRGYAIIKDSEGNLKEITD